MTSDIDSRSILISTAPVHDPVPDNITYFEDAYTHLRGFKPKVATVVPHPNANFKGKWTSIKGLFQDQLNSRPEAGAGAEAEAGAGAGAEAGAEAGCKKRL